MKKYFGMKKVSVRKETKSELSEQTAERRENKALCVVSCIFIIAKFVASIFFEEGIMVFYPKRYVLFSAE